ncbi:MAG: hypothetical protein ACTHVE_00320 [Senegalia sp. (in: firmicutes)]|uniref:hypothetical protein n=1 Tax=Senegalia sp. (in: firmicutes) TaxID=1924098 RepID=UPI003F9C983A
MSSIAYESRDRYEKEKYKEVLNEYKYIIKVIDSYAQILLINSDDEDISINLFDNNTYLIEQWGNDNYLKELEDIGFKKGLCLKEKCMNENIRRYKSYTSISLPIKNSEDKLLAILNITLSKDTKISKYHKSLLFIKTNLEEHIKEKKKKEDKNYLKEEIEEREKVFISVMENFNMTVMVLAYPSLTIEYINRPSKELINGITGLDLSMEEVYGISFYEIRKMFNHSLVEETIDRLSKRNKSNI